jgi:hypothetical protein
MQPKLKEDPREWRKFVLVGATVFTLASGLAWKRGRLSDAPFVVILVTLVTVVVAACAKPRWFRSSYRTAMTASFHVGQVMGRILLGILFLCFITPFALVLRLFGKDLLKLKRNPGSKTYWHPAKASGELDRQF